MTRIVLFVAVFAAVFAASAHAAAGRTIYVGCVDAAGAEWFVPIELVEQPDVDACVPLVAEGPLQPPMPEDPIPPAQDRPPDTSGIDVGLGADPNMDPDPSLYATEVLCPDGSIWAVAIGDQFSCPASP